MPRWLRSKLDFGIYHFLFLIILGVLLLGLLFNHFGISALDYGKFVLGLFFIVYVPGQSLCWLSKIQVRRLEMVTIAAAIGMVTSTVVNRLCRMFHLEVLFFFWLAASAGYFIWFVMRNRSEMKNFSFRITSVGVVFLIIILAVLAMLTSDNYQNGLRQPDGSVVINMRYYDGFVRNAVVRELSHSVPPQMPFASGLPLSYHYGMDLFISLFHRYLHLGVLDLIHRLTMTFFFLLLVSALFIFIRELTASEMAALLGVSLVLFGSGGLSYVATYFLGIYHWGHIFFSLYLFIFIGINSFLPAIGISAAGIFCLSKYLKTQRISWLLLTSLLFGLVFEYKMLFVGPIMGALLLSGILLYVFKRDFSLLKVFLGVAVLVFPLVIMAFLWNRGGPQFEFKFRFADWIGISIRDLKFVFLRKSWAGLVHRTQYDFVNFLYAIPTICIFYLGSFGLSFFALSSLFKKFFSFKKSRPLHTFLIVLFGGCILFFFFINMYLDGRVRNLTNIYVYFLGLIILQVFWSERVVNFCEKRKRAWKILAISLVLVMSVPNTVRFLWLKNQHPRAATYPTSFMETSAWVNANTDPESILLNSIRIKHACYFMDRRVVLDNTAHSFITWHLTTSQIEERVKDIRTFFKQPRLNADILEKYAVSYVLGFYGDGYLSDPENHSSPIDCYYHMGTSKIPKYRKSHELKLVFKNSIYFIFKVNRIPESERESFILEAHKGKLSFLRVV